MEIEEEWRKKLQQMDRNINSWGILLKRKKKRGGARAGGKKRRK